MDALYGISHAKNIDWISKSVTRHTCSRLEHYVRRQTKVMWPGGHAAKLYQMPDSAQTKLIMDGSSGL